MASLLGGPLPSVRNDTVKFAFNFFASMIDECMMPVAFFKYVARDFRANL